MTIRLRDDSDSDDVDGERESKEEPLFRSASRKGGDGNEDELDSEDEEVRRQALKEHLSSFGKAKESRFLVDGERARTEAPITKRKLELESDDDDLRKKKNRGPGKKVSARIQRQVSSDDDDIRKSSTHDKVDKESTEVSDVIFRSKSGARITRDEFLKERSLNGNKKRPEKIKRERLTEKVKENI